MLYRGYDASIPPASAPDHSQFALGYLGGNTPHVWTLEEWNEASNHGEIPVGGIWTVDFTGNPYEQADAAVKAAMGLGWAYDGHRLIVLDSEVSQNVAFIRTMAKVIKRHRFVPVDYRSYDAIIAAPSGLYEYIARWNETAGPFTSNAIAFQIQADVPWQYTMVDIDVADHVFYNLLGVRERHEIRLF